MLSTVIPVSITPAMTCRYRAPPSLPLPSKRFTVWLGSRARVPKAKLLATNCIGAAGLGEDAGAAVADDFLIGLQNIRALVQGGDTARAEGIHGQGIEGLGPAGAIIIGDGPGAAGDVDYEYGIPIRGRARGVPIVAVTPVAGGVSPGEVIVTCI
jgi:hypothetical protein